MQQLNVSQINFHGFILEKERERGEREREGEREKKSERECRALT